MTLLPLLLPLLLQLLAAGRSLAAPAEASTQEAGASRPIVTFQPGFPRRGVRRFLGEVSGVAVDGRGHSYLFNRADRGWGLGDFNDQHQYTKQKEGPIDEATIVEVDPEGNAVKVFGARQFYMPHGITVDGKGKLWMTDVARHQVVRIDATTGQVDLTVGEQFVPGNGSDHLCQPTKVAVASSGEFFVADGYCNNRVVKFDKDGKFVAEFGKAPSGSSPPADNELLIPHGLSLLEHLDLLCVADREHRRVQCYKAGIHDPKEFGHFVQSVDSGLGRVFDVDFTPTGELLILHSIDNSRFSLVNIHNLVEDISVGQFTFVPDRDGLEEEPFGFGSGHAVAAAPAGQFAIVASLSAICDTDDELCASGLAVPYQVFRFDIQDRRRM